MPFANPRLVFWKGVLAGGLGAALLVSGGFAYAATTGLFAPTVATVNGVNITESQMLWYLLTRDGEDVVKDLLFASILTGEAGKLGVAVDPKKADDILADIHGERLPLVQNGLNVAEVKTAILRELTAREVIKAKEKQLSADPKYAVTEDEIVQAYLENANNMTSPEQVMLSIINTSKLKDADDALAALNAGKSFAEVASQFSEDDVSKKTGGKLERPIPKGGFRGPLRKIDDIAFKLGAGAHSEVIAAADQYFIIQVDQKIPAREIPLDEARPVLKDKIEAYKIKPAMLQWREALGKAADLKILYPIFSVSEEELRNVEGPKDSKPKAEPASPVAGVGTP
ncbi:MAG: peptidyl-prolyl cis-trans isomerase [bacterium]